MGPQELLEKLAGEKRLRGVYTALHRHFGSRGRKLNASEPDLKLAFELRIIDDTRTLTPLGQAAWNHQHG